MTRVRLGALLVLVVLLMGASFRFLVRTPASPTAAPRAADGSVLVHIPAGPFSMGSDDGDLDEAPAHTVSLGAYDIGQAKVTNRQFAAFLEARRPAPTDPPLRLQQAAIQHDGPHWRVTPGREECPVTGVPWEVARAYCTWAGGRLPTEAEWEKAARGTDGRLYPWGNAWDGTRANGWRSQEVPTLDDPLVVAGMLTPAASHATGQSPYGCLDMAGNAWEWCSSLYAEYPWNAGDGREDPRKAGPRVIRGGSWYDHPSLLRCSNRFRVFADFDREADRPFQASTGFRVAFSAAASSPDAVAVAAPTPTAHATPGPIERRAHPQFQLLTGPLPKGSPEDLDARYRLKASPPPHSTILGYPVTREREVKYFVPIEHLIALSFYHAKPYGNVLPLLSLEPGQTIADIGAGSGAVTRMFAKAVGPAGRVWATDISISALRSMIPQESRAGDPGRDLYYFQRAWESTPNVSCVLHDVTDCLLPDDSVDLAFLGMIHYFHYPRARPGVSPPLAQVLGFYRSIRRSLRPAGRLAIVEHTENCRSHDTERGVLTVAEMVSQMRQAGFKLDRRHDMRDGHALLIFRVHPEAP